MDDLVDRLRGTYAVKVDDGAGPLNGKDVFTRNFPVPMICVEAADEIERLREAVKNMLGSLMVVRDSCMVLTNSPDVPPRFQKVARDDIVMIDSAINLARTGGQLPDA